MTNNVGLAFSVGDNTPQLQFVLSKRIRIGDTEYHFSVVLHMIPLILLGPNADGLSGHPARAAHQSLRMHPFAQALQCFRSLICLPFSSI